MCTRHEQSGPGEGPPQAAGRSKVLYELGHDTAGYSKAELREIIDGLVGRIRKLERELERSQKRGSQAGKRRGQRPRGKGGAGEPAYRKPPDDAQVTDEQDVPAKGGCPHCGSQLEHEGWQDAWVSDIPERQPRVTHLRVQVCRCTGCGATVRGRHPDVAPDQHGATAHRVGDRTMALAHWMHYDLQVTQRKVATIVQELTGVQITQGALAQNAQRRAGQLEDDYQAEREKIRQSELAHTDDTGWRVAGRNAQLMTFTTETEQDPTTVYQIRERHRNEEVREVLPQDWDGVMVTDRGKSYDAKPLQGVKQQKCQFHVLQSIEKVLDSAAREARQFAEELKQLCQEAIGLWHEHKEGKTSLPQYLSRSRKLLRRIDEHLQARQLADPDAQRLLNELGRHHERGNLFRFLTDPRVPPTNNLAERELRPEVIGRKVSGGSKNWNGARTRERLSTITRTERRRNPGGAVSAIYHRLRNARLRAQRPADFA